MRQTWDQIEECLRVTHKCATDAEWDEAKINAIENTVLAIISRLRQQIPDPPQS